MASGMLGGFSNAETWSAWKRQWKGHLRGVTSKVSTPQKKQILIPFQSMTWKPQLSSNRWSPALPASGIWNPELIYIFLQLTKVPIFIGPYGKDSWIRCLSTQSEIHFSVSACLPLSPWCVFPGLSSAAECGYLHGHFAAETWWAGAHHLLCPNPSAV